MVWSIATWKSVAAQTMEATAANRSPPVMGSGILYLERNPTLRLTSGADQQHDHGGQQRVEWVEAHQSM